MLSLGLKQDQAARGCRDEEAVSSSLLIEGLLCVWYMGSHWRLESKKVIHDLHVLKVLLAACGLKWEG